jgi:hypothetical protein
MTTLLSYEIDTTINISHARGSCSKEICRERNI